MTHSERLIPGYGVSTPMQNRSLYLLFQKQSLLVAHSTQPATIPTVGELKALGDQFLPEAQSDELYLGTLGGIDCYAGSLATATPPPDSHRWVSLRRLIDELPPHLVDLSSRAVQLLRWRRNHRYCGRCGKPTQAKSNERAMDCDGCQVTCYPRISPAMIVAVVRDRRLLLGRAPHFRPGLFSVLAGFVEPGETIEDCVRREVREESGIEVKNLKYFASQSWPFPDSLMLAFTAEYQSGEIDLTDSELEAVDWYGPADMPLIPGKVSVARRLIDWFIDTGGPDK
jgi:NAD+ diphosphatase